MWLPFILLFPFQLLAWLPLGYHDLIDSIECEQLAFETSFETNVHVETGISYPVLPGTNMFVKHVNQVLKEDAHRRFDQYIHEMNIPQKDVWEDDPDREFQYCLFPICHIPNLISICGYEYHYRTPPHGSWLPIGKTFWQKDLSISELVLEDIFLPESNYRQFLVRYCENYFKTHNYGYYAYKDLERPVLKPNDLGAFVLTKRGLLIIFKMYSVNGLNDGPDTLLIPYSTLTAIANPNGPIPYLLQMYDH